MTLRRRTRRAPRTRGRVAPVMKAMHSPAGLRQVPGARRRRPARGLALRSSPIGLLVGGAALWLLGRRRRRARLEADLGPPNESAPGHAVPAPTSAASPPADPAAGAPNEGAPGHQPEPEAETAGSAPGA